jgi:hypothetical protein
MDCSHPSPDKRKSTSRDSASFVRDLDSDVLWRPASVSKKAEGSRGTETDLIPLCDDNLDRRIVLAIHPVRLDDGTERVLENLEEDVVLKAKPL